MAFTPYRTWTAGEIVTASMMNQQIRDNGNILINFQRGGTIYVAGGITAAADVILWEATEACSVQFVKGYRAGGSAAGINARKNGSLEHLSGDLSLSASATWFTNTAIINPNYAVGDSLEMRLKSVAGSPTQVNITIGFTY